MSFSVPQFFFIIVLGEHTEIIALTPVLPLLDVFFFSAQLGSRSHYLLIFIWSVVGEHMDVRACELCFDRVCVSQICVSTYSWWRLVYIYLYGARSSCGFCCWVEQTHRKHVFSYLQACSLVGQRTVHASACRWVAFPATFNALTIHCWVVALLKEKWFALIHRIHC